MAVDRWGKDCEAANAALRGFVTDAKAAFAALWGDRVNHSFLEASFQSSHRHKHTIQVEVGASAKGS